MSRGGRLLAAGGLAASLAVAWYLAGGGSGDSLPARMRLAEVVADLSGPPGPGVVVQQRDEAPVRWGGLSPSRHHGDVEGGRRPALVAPAPSLLRFRLRVPARAALEFSVGVEGDGRRDAEAAGVRFTVRVDGREVFSRVVDPARTRHDRRWFHERVDLRAAGGREAEIALATDLEGTGRAAGTPGWSHVRLVRESERERQRASPAAPSVLVLLVDTLRADRLGCYGAEPSPSPTLDALAASGVVFEQAVAQASWTLPSVASLFTGLHPRSHGMVGRGADGAEDAAFLPDAIRTLAEQAQAAGITTVGVSANPLVSRATNLGRGFETLVELGWDRARRDWPRAALVNGPFLAWLRQNRELRFLGYLHYMEPHDPYAPPEALRPPRPPRVRRAITADFHALAQEINFRGGTPLSAEELDYVRALYDAEIRAWDAELRVLLDALGALGLRESTVIVVVGDHGEEFQEHGRLKHRLQLYEESIRVPLVIAGPAVPPRRVAEQAQGVDLFPTVAALLGLERPPGLPGGDVLAARAAGPAVSETSYGVAPDGGQTEMVSLRTARWKLIHAPALGHFELYDLERDPGERENRFAGAPEGAVLAERLAAFGAAAPAPPPAAGADPTLREKLRALGYVD